MEQSDYTGFINKVLHRGRTTNHKISGSLGVYDCYKYLRKNKWLDIPRPITENEFYNIIRKCNNLLKDNLVAGNSIIFPYRLGTLELLKSDTKVEFKDGKLKTNKRVNWFATLKLWYEDIESRSNKTLVRFNSKSNIRIRYNKSKAIFNNSSFYSFKPNKPLLIEIKKLFNEGLIDAMQVNYGME